MAVRLHSPVRHMTIGLRQPIVFETDASNISWGGV
jgi:hypothetical protein